MRVSRDHQRGLTLVELMVAMAVGGIVIALVLGIYTRMSVGFRAQAHIAEMRMALTNVEETLVREVQRAGARIPDGFFTPTHNSGDAVNGPWKTMPPIQVFNNAFAGTDGDAIRLWYADESRFALVDSFVSESRVFDTLDPPPFAVGDKVFLVVAKIKAPDPGGGPDLVTYVACLGEVAVVQTGGPFRIELDQNLPYGSPGAKHCDDIRAEHTAGRPVEVYGAIERAFRIDPTAGRRPLGVLQISPTAAFKNDWEDLAVGFATMQIATRFWCGDTSPTGCDADHDADGDPEHNWMSGDNQEIDDFDPSQERIPVAVSIGLEARTFKTTQSVSTRIAHKFWETGKPQTYNAWGDRDEFTIPGPAAYLNRHVYRWTRQLVDLRNIGVGL